MRQPDGLEPSRIGVTPLDHESFNLAAIDIGERQVRSSSVPSGSCAACDRVVTDARVRIEIGLPGSRRASAATVGQVRSFALAA
jgi:hypothetical protein